MPRKKNVFVPLTILLRPDERAWLEKRAEKDDRSMNSVIRSLIDTAAEEDRW